MDLKSSKSLDCIRLQYHPAKHQPYKISVFFLPSVDKHSLVVTDIIAAFQSPF